MDNSIKQPWWQTHKPTKRRLIQLYSALLYNAQLKGFVTGNIYKGPAKNLCVPGLNCYSCPGAIGACPLGAFQNALGTLDQRIGFYVAGILMLYGILLGRSICGWICPFGMIQELLYKIPVPKLHRNRITRKLSYFKYVLLAVFVIAVPMYFGILKSIPVPGFCKYICPAGTLEGAMGLIPGNLQFLSMFGKYFTGKFVIMLFIGLACVFCFRSFCRFLCPLGAIYGMFSGLAVTGVKVDTGSCSGCGACVRGCRMDVARVGDHECIHCADCVASCPTGAISLMPSLRGNNAETQYGTSRRIAKIFAIIVLSCALIWFNVFDTSENKTGISDNKITNAPVGYDVGDQLADFSTECIDGSEFKLSDNRGRVVVINLWGTYCGPCVKELPYFEEVYNKHKDDMAFIAVHSNLTDRDVNEFVNDKGWDFPVAIDNDNEEIFSIVNSNGVLPQTIVLNRYGEVIYNVAGSVTPELLEQLYEQAAL